MELNLMSTDQVYPNINVVFDDSLYQVSDDTAFVLTVNERFNSSITFPSYAESIRIVGNPYNFNQPVSIPQTVTNLSGCFQNCYNFNQPVNISDNCVYLINVFRNCRNFNQPITIPNSAKYISSIFQDCSNFNQPITIPNGVIECGNMFNCANNYNSEVVLEDGLKNCSHMFESCLRFNRPINIPNSVTNCASMFYSYTADVGFNQAITIPKNVLDCSYMFKSSKFNNSVVFEENSLLKNCYQMFDSCTNFNYSINIPNGVTNCMNMFNGINNFNSIVVIPSSVFSTVNMFYGVRNGLKQPIYFYTNSINQYGAQTMFFVCNNLSEIYLIGVQNNLQLHRFMRNNGSVRCNIYTDDVSQNYLYNTSLLVNSSMPVWTNDTANGCIYNTVVNLYIYNNWDGVVPET